MEHFKLKMGTIKVEKVQDPLIHPLILDKNTKNNLQYSKSLKKERQKLRGCTSCK